MHSRPCRKRFADAVRNALIICVASWCGQAVQAQSTTVQENTPPSPKKNQKLANGVAAGATAKAQPPAKPDPTTTRAVIKTVEPRREPSEAYKESLRKTLEKRRQRRVQRAQTQGIDEAQPIGAIVPWPMPPALIIRQTPEVHREVESLLGQLRRSTQ